MATSDESGVKTLLPKENKVILENGREIEYESMVLATGIGSDYDSVPGLKECLEAENCPVYSTDNFGPSDKYTECLALFESGSSFFFIPPFPFSGEVETYNFLVALDLWDYSEKIGLVSPKRKVTIVNANDKFSSHSPVLDKYIKKALENFDVEIIYNTKLNSINKDKRVLKLSDGSKHDFNHVYYHPPSKKNPILENTGLSSDGLKMDVDHQTLQSTAYGNIFGVGDICNLPIQPSLFAGFAQNHVVRHNVLQSISGKPINAKYEGYSKLFLSLTLTQSVGFTSNFKTESLNTTLPYLQKRFQHLKGYFSTMSKVYDGKKAGPPGFRYPKWDPGSAKKKTPSG